MFNKLENEDSLYLKSHSTNLINWYPWGEEALNRAKDENKLIFLTIGYSGCHWCNTMRQESFENEEIAKILNDNFISIIVDKEERIDINKHFQYIYKKMNNKDGGWPLSIFMTYDKIPVYSANYIPPIANYGKMGFKDLLKIISISWQKDKDSLIAKGQNILDSMQPSSKIEATKIDNQLEKIATSQIKQLFDKSYGGFGLAPKFLHSSTLDLDINLYKLTKDKELKNIFTHTLDNISIGGVYDIVEGGFFKFSKDNMWLVPYFEKSLYDNALIAQTYIKAYEATKIDRYRDIAIDTINFILKNMSQNMLFYSTIGINSSENDFFIYDYNEVKDAFEKNGIDLSKLFELSITKNGNFNGKSIPRYIALDVSQKDDTKEAIKVLKKLREAREYPLINKMVITSWNAMVITALFKLSKYENRYLDIALKSLNKLKSKMVNGVKIYHNSLVDSNPKIDGFLEDYAYYIDMLIEAYNQTLDEIYLIEATSIANEAIRVFYKQGRWQVGSSKFRDFEEDIDIIYSSPLSLMVKNLLILDALVEPVYEKFAFMTLQVNSYNLMRQPISRPTLTNYALAYLKKFKVIKANLNTLKKVRLLEFNNPYILLKPTLNNFIEVCDSQSCFTKVDTIEELKALNL